MRAATAWMLAWYALIPPLAADGEVDPRAPLSRWEQLRAFDTAEACEQTTMGYVRRLADGGDFATYRQAQYARCIHASDPRLGGGEAAR